MNKKQFQKFLNRDKHCYHCGSAGEDLIPQHRANRGMGGSKLRERPSNVVAFCSLTNGLIESDAQMAQDARWFGWKLETWEDPLETPIYDRSTGYWYLLDDSYGRKIFEKLRENG
jgi:hypothetical protein